MKESPISPSISAFGTNAATESTTITSTAPLLTSASAISSACSPVSGCETIKLAISTPKFLAYAGSNACSASINAAMPPFLCASAIICNATVVLPDDSGPYISTILPFGTPPIPIAKSNVNAPVEIASIFNFAFSPNFIIEPFPNCFSIPAIANSRAFSFSISILLLEHLFVLLYILYFTLSIKITYLL